MADSKLITGSINLSDIDKTKLFKGKKGVYLNINMWLNEEEDDYGNHGNIQQTLSKEEREAGADKIWLGNIKVMQSGGLQPASEAEVAEALSEEDLAF